MSRSSFLNMMAEYRPLAWDEEHQAIDEVMQHVKTRNDCFERYTPAEGERAYHITSSVVLLSHDMEKILLMHHKKLDKWLQLGGHMDGNKDVIDVAIKEVEEESGITGIHFLSQLPVDVARIDFEPEVFGYAKTIYDIRFLATAPEGAQAHNNNESKELQWLNPGKATMLAEDNELMIRLLMKWTKAMRQHKAA